LRRRTFSIGSFDKRERLAFALPPIGGETSNPMEKIMTLYVTLANLISGLPSLLDRLTISARRNGLGGVLSRQRLQSSQSPPDRLTAGRQRSLWAYRLRIESVRPETLSAHLRRDIGLDL
jgi:hypothetical protein